MTTTPKPQTGMWILTAPNGKQWQADSPLKVCGAEHRERVPAEVGLSRVFAAIAQPAEKCFCDANNLGAPSVSCGDCPTRDYNIAQPEQPSLSKTTIEKLHTFLDASAGDGVISGGVDAADLYIEIFPENYARAAIAQPKDKP